jgi:7-dehydrocholesterol reductase
MSLDVANESQSRPARWGHSAVVIALMTITPPLSLTMWMINTHYQGSIARFVAETDVSAWLEYLPQPNGTALCLILFWTLWQASLLRFLPGREWQGAATASGTRPRYRLNGPLAWLVTHTVLLLIAWRWGYGALALVYEQLGALLTTLNLVALALCVLIFGKGVSGQPHPDKLLSGNPVLDFYRGIELHPAWLGMDLKQLLICRVSMMGWSAMVLACVAEQIVTHGRVTSAMAVSAFLMCLYIFKFFCWERGYFNSLDIIHDRFGFYLCWGVLVWVPAVYTLPVVYLASHPVELPPMAAAAIGVLGISALAINYAADRQRQKMRDTNGQMTVWGRPAITLPAPYIDASGQRRVNRLLVSGWWGLARHLNYLPELIVALAWSLTTGFDAFLPYGYVVFLAILLIHRAERDDQRCQQKYQAAWTEYRRRVPYKIVPYLY